MFGKVFSSPLTSLRSRFYGSAASLSRKEVEAKVFKILQGFSKIDEKKISLDADYYKDLGLDSLDTVEVVMAIEEEFLITVPDQIADGLKTVQETVDFIATKTKAE